MNRLFLLMGKSSTGKDSIYKKLLLRGDLGLRQIIPYTTRPIRAGEVDGADYHFCDGAKLDDLLSKGKVIEHRAYPTIHGRWDYFTVDDENFRDTSSDLIMIGTLDTYEKLLDYCSDREIVPIYIEVEDGVRLQRALEREMTQIHPRYEELCRRFLADSRDFSEENLERLGITQRFVNDDVDNTVERIAEWISK